MSKADFSGMARGIKEWIQEDRKSGVNSWGYAFATAGLKGKEKKEAGEKWLRGNIDKDKDSTDG